MSAIRSLRIKLGATDVGSLFALDDGRTYFRIDQAYALDATRPILSLSYQGETANETQQALLNPTLENNVGAGNGKLPNFFRNLLAEGVLRKHLIMTAQLEHNDELGLLAFCGTDLPGNILALSEQLTENDLGRLMTQGRDSYEMSSYQTPTPEAFSLSGVQPKVELVSAPGGRYVMRSKTDNDSHFIGKLPASDHEGMPEVEFLSMQLAQIAGVNVCHVELKPLAAIADLLPFAMRDDARNFLLVRRFDRDQPTPNRRKHMEDFAQVLNLSPDDKYDGDYASIAVTLQDYSSRGNQDVFELLRRIKVNEMLGNVDAHVKNFSLLYETPTTPCLSPAYDIVAYCVYVEGTGHGLRFFPDSKEREKLSPSLIRELANVLQIPEKTLSNVVAETVKAAVAAWPRAIRKSSLSREQKRKLLRYFKNNPSVSAVRKRQKAKRAR